MSSVDVSVIIPVGPKHSIVVGEALLSVYIQDFKNLEVIVVNDSGVDISPFGNFYVTLDRHKIAPGSDPWGPGLGRNLGVYASSGAGLMFLDADDVLVPGAIKALWAKFVELGGTEVIYGDVIRADTHEIHVQADQYCGDDLLQTSLHNPKRMPTHLVPRWAHDLAGGWDETMGLWEDIDYEIRMDIAGVCATHINYPVYYYRFDTGTRRIQGADTERKQEARKVLQENWKQYYGGKKKMGCSSCGSKKVAPSAPPSTSRRTSQKLPDIKTMLALGAVLELEFIQNTREKRTYIGPVTSNRYQFADSVARLKRKRIGNGPDEVDPEDAVHMITWHQHNYPMFRIREVRPPQVDPQSRRPRQEPRRKEQSEIKVDPSQVIGDDERAQIKKEIDALFEGRAGSEKRPEPVEEPEVVEEPVQVEPQEEEEWEDASAGFENSVKDYTVSAMKNLVDMMPEDQLREWLEEESSSGNPRVTMVSLLEGAVDG